MSVGAHGPPAGARLGGTDGVHLHAETDRTPMHTLKVFVLAPVGGRSSVDPHQAVTALGDLAARLPFFRVVAHADPVHLDQPRWYPASEIDLGYHVRRGAVAAPGSPRALDARVSEITRERLDPRRPLWQAWVLDGLAEGRVAVVLKLHHALADGVAAANMLASVTLGDTTWPDAGIPVPAPGPLRALAAAGLGRGRRLGELPALVADTRRIVRETASLGHESLGTSGPPHLFRGSLNQGRSYATISLDFEAVRLAREAVTGATINDVVLGLTGGALRTLLDARGILPSRTLLTGVPVSADPPDAPPRMWGNGWSQLMTTLATDTADPVERLQRIHATTAGAKSVQRLQTDLAARWIDQVPPVMLRTVAALAARTGLGGKAPLPGVSVSNVRGPAQRVRLPEWGFEIVELYSVGQILDGVGLNVTAWSYAGRLQVVALTSTAMLADAHEVTEGMDAELETLLAVVRTAGRVPTSDASPA